MGERGDQIDIEVIEKPVSLEVLKRICDRQFGDFVKAVVDIDREVMTIGGELHADEEAVLLNRGSAQRALWGINLHPAEYPADDWVDFDSMINIRPAQGNRSRSVEDEATQQRIRTIVTGLVRSNG